MPWIVLFSEIAKPMVAIIGARCGAWRARSGAKIKRSSSQPAPAGHNDGRQNAAAKGSLNSTTACSAA